MMSRIPQIPREYLVPLPSTPVPAPGDPRPPRDPRPPFGLTPARLLAWLGGITTLIGIVLLLAVAIAHGWIGREARVILAGAGCAALMLGGAWLRRLRGRTEASIVMVGAGTAGMFVTLVVASAVYHLIAPVAALAGMLATGAIATALAVRWAGQAIGAIGLVGALLSPILAQAPYDRTTMIALAIATTCAVIVVVWRDWAWLAVAAQLISAPQWIAWLSDPHGLATEAVALAGFGGLGLLGALGAQLRGRASTVRASAAALLVLNAFVTATVGGLVLRWAAGPTAAAFWLAGFGLLHAVLGVQRRVTLPHRFRALLIAVGAILADVAFGVAAGGMTLTIGWGVVAIACAVLARRTTRDQLDQAAIGVGLGAHIGLVLLRAVLALPPGYLAGGYLAVTSPIAVATLAATCLICGRVVGAERRPWQLVLDAVGLTAIAYLTAAVLSGDALVLAWAIEAAALAQFHRLTGDQLPRFAALAFLAGAVAHVMAVEAPVQSIAIGVPNLKAAMIVLAAVAVALLQLSRALDDEWAWLARGGAAATVLYAASVGVVTAFQPMAGDATATVFDLTVRQEGQVLLSALWSVVGFGALLLGLRRRLDFSRNAGFGLLLLTAGKVFLFDLSTLTSIYRVISFVVLGLLLLAGGFAYQRMRPSPTEA